MYIPHFVYPFIFWWTLRLLPPLGCCAAMIMGVYKHLFETALSVLLGLDPEVELLDHKIIMFNFVRNCHTIFQSDLHYLTFLPISNLFVFFLAQTFLPFGGLFYFKGLTWSPAKEKGGVSLPFLGGGCSGRLWKTTALFNDLCWNFCPFINYLNSFFLFLHPHFSLLIIFLLIEVIYSLTWLHSHIHGFCEKGAYIFGRTILLFLLTIKEENF